ncbi:polyprenyl synthetase family protein [Kitasatospora sp. NBC_00315]|uniref:polyprenyl synthetase family protein n=1 Tax=Kitasatospora sp. NBC_00315 TaxID=2975963 RepID=UPI00324C2970
MAGAGSPAAPDSAGLQLLGRAREAIQPELRKAVDRLSDPTRTVAGYHLGWCDRDGYPTAANPGKGIRPALVLACAQAVGGPAEAAYAPAAAVELVHQFSILHDDLMDADATRRGRPTAWAVFGKAQALLAGDALLVLAFRILTELPTPQTEPGCARELSGTLLELVIGQAADLAFEERSEVALDECLAMAGGKTASLFAAACAIGGMAAVADPARVRALRAFGWHLGLSFQLVDDWLGVWGDPRTTGKPVRADLLRRKKSLPVVAALHSGTPAGRRLAELYGRGRPLSDDEAVTAAALVEDAGGRDWVEREAARQKGRAMAELALAEPTPEAADALASLARAARMRDS